MIPIERDLQVVHSGEPIKRRQAKLSEENLKWAIPMFRDEFYSNKKLAPIREYSTNARDAHIVKGTPTRQIEVTLPSRMNPEFKVRDFGAGLSQHELDTVYFEYCASTKRNSNDTNGVWGIGSKSAFAYTESYVVTTWCEGMKTIMNCTIDGNIDTIYYQPNAENEPEGVEIAIPIQMDDIDQFNTEALNFYKYWDVRPIFHNVDNDTLLTAFATMDQAPFLTGDGWAIRPAGYGSRDAVAVMGFVPYPIDWNQVKGAMNKAVFTRISGMFDFLESNLTTLTFPNGTLKFTPNREALQYKDETLKAITDKLTAMYDALLNAITEKISVAKNLWEAKMIYNRIFRRNVTGFEGIALFEGDLHAIEILLSKEIKWNGIILENGMFEGLAIWDKELGNIGTSSMNTPVLQTYVKDPKKDGRVKHAKCAKHQNNKILCAPGSRVIIQDTDKPRLGKGAAQMILLDPNSGVTQVYVLNLQDAKVRQDFFNFYNFDTVPVEYVSKNVDTIKAYIKKNRAPSQGGGRAAGSSFPLLCSYFTIENRTNKSSNGWVAVPDWQTETVNAREVDGGLYVIYDNKEVVVDSRSNDLNNLRYAIQGIYELFKLAGMKTTKIYGLHRRSINAKWFKQSTNWTELSVVLKQLMEKHVNLDDLSDSMSFNNTEIKVGSAVTKKLADLLDNKEGIMAKYCEMVNRIQSFQHIPSLIDRWNLTDFMPSKKDDKDMNKQGKLLKKTYPLLFRLDNQRGLINCGDDNYYKMQDGEILEIAEYINLMDKRS